MTIVIYISTFHMVVISKYVTLTSYVLSPWVTDGHAMNNIVVHIL